MTTPFTIILPTTITDSNFVSSTILEEDFPLYNAGTTYALGDRVIITTGYHKIYESLANSNTGNFPPNSPTLWVEVGPTNRWALFDESGGTLTSGMDSFTFAVTGDRLTSIGLLELSSASVRIQASSVSEGTYYDETYVLPDATLVSDWYLYFFAPIRRKQELVITDIPPISMSTYTITITGVGAISLGTFVIGMFSVLGLTQYNPKIGIVDYSRKEVDQFGRATLVRRNFAKRMDVQLYVNSGNVDALTRELSSLRAINVLWVGSKDIYDSLTIFGFYRDFSIDIAFPTFSVCTLQVEGISQ